MSVASAIGALALAGGSLGQTAQAPQEVPAPSATQEEATNEIVVSSSYRHATGDPLERVNAISFALTQKVDDAITAPASRVYQHVVPKPVRSGFRNFLNNLREPVVFVNYMLQLKPGKAAETVGRFALNSTLGLGGVIDVAKRCPFNLPWRPNGFSDTLGVYGVGNGPFIFVPLIGPTTVRDLVGGAVDRLASPFVLGGPFRSKPYLIGTNVYRVLDRRAEQEDELARVKASEDPYAARRDLFLEKRRERLERVKGMEAAAGTEATRKCRHRRL
jgi:phospholipid-binding lipoprotein MlaA